MQRTFLECATCYYTDPTDPSAPPSTRVERIWWGCAGQPSRASSQRARPASPYTNLRSSVSRSAYFV